MKTIRTIKVRLYPNKHMKQILDDLCDYRRYCWNQGLETWNKMYDLHCIDKSYKAKGGKPTPLGVGWIACF